VSSLSGTVRGQLIGQTYRLRENFRLEKRSLQNHLKVTKETMEMTMYKATLAAVAMMLVATFMAAPADAGRCVGPYDSAKDFFMDQQLCQ
jgi:hypothetical protein